MTRRTFPCCIELADAIARMESLVAEADAIAGRDPEQYPSLYEAEDALADLRAQEDAHRQYHRTERRLVETYAENVVLSAALSDAMEREAARATDTAASDPEAIFDWGGDSGVVVRYAVFGWFLAHDEWPTPQEAWQACMDYLHITQPSAQALVAHALDAHDVEGVHTVTALRLGEAIDHGDDDAPFRICVAERYWPDMRAHLADDDHQSH